MWKGNFSAPLSPCRRISFSRSDSGSPSAGSKQEEQHRDNDHSSHRQKDNDGCQSQSTRDVVELITIAEEEDAAHIERSQQPDQ